MSSCCALFDALSTTLPTSETSGGVENVKLLDIITHAVGLSGGSWMLMVSLIGGATNPFHTPPSGAGAEVVDNPWLYGKGHHFVEGGPYQYEGLLHMREKDQVDRSCYRSKTTAMLANLAASHGADPTIPNVLFNKSMGTCFIQRWSNFLANNILNFADGFQKPHDEPSQHEEQRASRQLKLSDLKDLITSGDMPFVVVSAVADRELASDEEPGLTVRSFDWVEFTPFFSRHPARGIDVDDVDDMMRATFPREHDSEDGDDHHVPMFVHRIMAIAGSAFAFNLAIVAPKSLDFASSLTRFAAKFGEDASAVKKEVTAPLVGGTTKVVLSPSTAKQTQQHSASSNNIAETFGVLRDAGIDFNVPLPAMLPDASRSFDIIVVHDAGEERKGAFELQRAVELGYIKLAPGQPHPGEDFQPGERVRVWRGMPGYPSIIYFLGITNRPTHELAQDKDALLSDLATVRQTAITQLQPAILRELTFATNDAQRRIVLPPSTSEHADREKQRAEEGQPQACCSVQ